MSEPNLWTRRSFTRALGGALLGGIFVPKYERWFRPNSLLVLSGPPVFVGHSVVDWPLHRPDDLALMVVQSNNRAARVLTPGWEPWWSQQYGSTHMSAYWKRASHSREARPRLSRGAMSPQIMTFRGVAKNEYPFKLTTTADLDSPGVMASLTVTR